MTTCGNQSGCIYTATGKLKCNKNIEKMTNTKASEEQVNSYQSVNYDEKDDKAVFNNTLQKAYLSTIESVQGKCVEDKNQTKKVINSHFRDNCESIHKK